VGEWTRGETAEALRSKCQKGEAVDYWNWRKDLFQRGIVDEKESERKASAKFSEYEGSVSYD